MPFEDLNFNIDGKPIIYGGFYLGSTEIEIYVKNIVGSWVIKVYNEDTAELLGQNSSSFEYMRVTVPALTAGRIIAFVDEFGEQTAGGVQVMDRQYALTGWLSPGPVDEESVPVDIGLFNPAIESPITAKYDPSIVNIIPELYRQKAIDFASDPMLFDVKITYLVDAGTNDKTAQVVVSNVVNFRGGFTVVIDGTVGSSKNFIVDKTFNIIVTDSEARTATKSVTVNPVTAYYPVPPTPPVSDIVEYKTSADFGTGVYFVRADARTSGTGMQMEVSFDGGTVWYDMLGSPGGTQQGYLLNNVLPTTTTIIMRIKANPSDFITRVIPVPYP